MITVNDIRNNANNYRIVNGIVYDNKTNQRIGDNEKINEIKMSHFILKEARKARQDDVIQFGNKINKSEDKYDVKAKEALMYIVEMLNKGLSKIKAIQNFIDDFNNNKYFHM